MCFCNKFAFCLTLQYFLINLIKDRKWIEKEKSLKIYLSFFEFLLILLEHKIYAVQIFTHQFYSNSTVISLRVGKNTLELENGIKNCPLKRYCYMEALTDLQYFMLDENGHLIFVNEHPPPPQWKSCVRPFSDNKERFASLMKFPNSP